MASFEVLDFGVFGFEVDFDGAAASLAFDFEVLGSLLFAFDGFDSGSDVLTGAAPAFVEERVCRFFGSGASAGSTALRRLGGIFFVLFWC